MIGTYLRLNIPFSWNLQTNILNKNLTNTRIADVNVTPSFRFKGKVLGE